MSNPEEVKQLDDTPATTFAAKGALPLEEALHSLDHDQLLSAAADPALTRDLALALLKRADLPSEMIEELAKNRPLLKLRKVKLALASHPRAPRRVSLPLIRQLYTLDLMRIALSPVVPADVKRRADETLMSRVKTITPGERLTLARQGSEALAGALLLDPEERIMRAALENARLTEDFIVRAVLKSKTTLALIQAVSNHTKWSYRRDVQLALLRTEHLSLGRALTFARTISAARLLEILEDSNLPKSVKDQLLRNVQPTPAE